MIDIEQCNWSELYFYYLDDLHNRGDHGIEFVNELRSNPRYDNDYEFRVTADFLSMLASMSTCPMNETISDCLDLIDRTTAMELWQLVAHCWNILGSKYFGIRMTEQAVECFVRSIVVESKHGLLRVTADAYLNLSLIYFELELYEKALEYIKLSNEALEKFPMSNQKFEQRRFGSYVLMLQTLSNLNREEEFEALYLKFKSLYTAEHLTDPQKYTYYINEVHYFLHLFLKGKADIEDCVNMFKESEKYFPNSEEISKVYHYCNYIKLFVTKRMDPDYYKDQIYELERLLPTDSAKVNATAMKYIIDFYKQSGDYERVNRFKDIYLDALYQTTEVNREQQRSSIDLVQTLLTDVSANEVGNQNLELKLLYKEAMKMKNDLQDAYQRIESINKIGKQLTSALGLNEVIGNFHEVLKERLQIDTFILFVVDEEERLLRSSIFYYNGEMQPEMKIDLDDSGSLCVQCYRTNELINLDMDLNKDAKRKNMNDDLVMRSAIYLPLSVGDKVIGVYTIQHHERNIYKDDLEFLRALAPFVAIALNNAIRSRTLEKEIHSHILTQNQLQAANKSLERISMQDGLTHISSRRNFEQNVLELIEDAVLTEDSVSVFMIDVDYFKLYNDTYGHLEGDEVLKKVANIFKKHMDAAGGLAARFGGEEFVGACKGMTFEENRNLAEKIRLSIYNLNIEHKVIPLRRVTVSIGVSYADADHTTTRTDMMRLADTLLYEAKNAGRNQSVIGYSESSI